MPKPGGLTDRTDVKFLLLYILDACADMVSSDDLNDIIRTDDLVDFFEYTTALSELLESGHIVSSSYEGKEYYTITPLGLETLSLFQKRLKYHVRAAAHKAAEAVLQKTRRREKIRAEYVPLPSGDYLISLSFFDEEGELLSIRLKAPTRDAAQKACETFSKNAERTVLEITQLLNQE